MHEIDGNGAWLKVLLGNMATERMVPLGTETNLRGRRMEGSRRIEVLQADGMSIEDFETDLKSTLYKIRNRMSSGTYSLVRCWR